jgi:hypothetical protein
MWATVKQRIQEPRSPGGDGKDYFRTVPNMINLDLVERFLPHDDTVTVCFQSGRDIEIEMTREQLDYLLGKTSAQGTA